MFRTKAEGPAVRWVTVVAESFWHDDGRFMRAGTLVSRRDPALKQNPQFFKRVIAEEVLTDAQTPSRTYLTLTPI